MEDRKLQRGLFLVTLDLEQLALPSVVGVLVVVVVRVDWRSRSRADDLLKNLKKASRNLVEVRL